MQKNIIYETHGIYEYDVIAKVSSDITDREIRENAKIIRTAKNYNL